MARIIGLGELLIDFTPAGRSENGLPLIEQNPGGAVPNCLAAAAKHGVEAAFIGKVGDDMHGRYLKSALEKAGIDAEHLKVDKEHHTTLAFVSLMDNGEREFSFLRDPGADTQLGADEVDKEFVRGATVFHVGSLSLTHEPARAATWKAVIAAKSAGALVSYDPNYRAPLWRDVATARDQMQSLLPVADIVKISDEELIYVAETEDIDKAIAAIRTEGPSVIVVTLGSKGAIVANREETRRVEGFPVSPVDTTGAGDAFFGGFLAEIIKSGKALRDIGIDELAEYARVGCATASLCVRKRGGMPSMPGAGEVEALLKDNG